MFWPVIALILFLLFVTLLTREEYIMSGSNRGGLYNPSAKKPSSTAGREKNWNCKKTENKVMLAKDSKFSRKNPEKYHQDCMEVDKLNK